MGTCKEKQVTNEIIKQYKSDWKEKQMKEYLKHVIEDVQTIYSRIEDDTSRQIFESRLMLTLAQRKKDENIVDFLRAERDKDKRLLELFGRKVETGKGTFIYGAGECGRYLAGSRLMEGTQFLGFIDSKEWAQGTIQGAPVYKPEDAVKVCDSANVILSMQAWLSRRQAKAQLEKMGVEWRVIDVGGVLFEIDRKAIFKHNDPYYRHFYNLLRNDAAVIEAFEKIRNTERPIACWCSFEKGDFIGKLLKEECGEGILPWQCYIVKEKDRGEYNGIPVYTYEEAAGIYDSLDIVIETQRDREDALEKITMGKVLGEVIDFYAIEKELYRRQYFDFFKYDGGKETFVDAGVCNLESTLGFIDWCNGNYNRVFAFEPDDENYKHCKERCALMENVSLFHSGLFDRRGNIGFTSGLGGSSRVVDRELATYADSEIQVVDLDSVVKGEEVSFIKMDIEGAEEKALLGAKRIITEQKPKLAISVYHKPEDIIELPALVLSMRPDYNLAFRHYSANSTNETVMYAW